MEGDARVRLAIKQTLKVLQKHKLTEAPERERVERPPAPGPPPQGPSRGTSGARTERGSAERRPPLPGASGAGRGAGAGPAPFQPAGAGGSPLPTRRYRSESRKAQRVLPERPPLSSAAAGCPRRAEPVPLRRAAPTCPAPRDSTHLAPSGSCPAPGMRLAELPPRPGSEKGLRRVGTHGEPAAAGGTRSGGLRAAVTAGGGRGWVCVCARLAPPPAPLRRPRPDPFPAPICSSVVSCPSIPPRSLLHGRSRLLRPTAAAAAAPGCAAPASRRGR